MKFDPDEDLIHGASTFSFSTAIAVIIGLVGIVCLLMWA